MRESDYEAENNGVSEGQNDNIVDTDVQSEDADEFDTVEEKNDSRHHLPFFSTLSSTDVLSFADEGQIRRRGFLPTLCRGVKRILNFCCCNKNNDRRNANEHQVIQ